MFALIDCNNFFASCERLFQPALAKQPIVILSNNDGCVISRSNEAKVLGIKMGAPYFEIKALCKQFGVQVFSSNYGLYSDLSWRVMSVIEESWPEVELYSIDEAFLDLRTLAPELADSFCCQLQEKIRLYTGIPVSIGIGATKTLAKLANYIAKKELKAPVFHLTNQQEWFRRIAVGEVWGIGRAWDKKLFQQGIYTVSDLMAIDLAVLKQRFNVVLQRTVLELRGIACANLNEQPESKKSLISSRSFGSLQTDYEPIAEALSGHCARAWEKLRQQKLLARHLSIFIRTNRFRVDLPQYAESIGFQLDRPSDDLPYLTSCAKLALKRIYRPGLYYQKVGIHLGELITKERLQLDLFKQASQAETIQREKLMVLFDKINRKYGRNSLHLAAEGHLKPWAMRSELRSPNYTTRWTELAKAIVE